MSSDPSTAVESLSTSLSVLEAALAPLLATPLEETLAQNDAEPLQKAKLQVMVGYVVHDLIWIYLKTSGVDPSTHPVMQELTRLKGYFDKLQTAEGSSSTSSSTEAPQTPSTRDGPRFTIDKAAASRFINAAIASQKGKVDPFYTAPPPEHSTDANAEAGSSTGVHTRFDAAAAKLLESEDDESDESGEAMVVTRADDSLDDEMLIVEKIRGGDDDEVLIVEELPKKVVAEKIPTKGRPKMDPFAGYDSPKPTPPKGKGNKPEGKRAGGPLSKRQRKKLALKKAQEGAGASA